MDGGRPIDVMIWSDFVCPFCNVARERAAFLREEAGARIDWLPFDLHPEYPPEGIPRAELVRRYGASFSNSVRRMNEEAGLVYNPHPERVPNTRRALELGEWARARGAYDAVHERIMNAYWTEGRDITGWDVLAPLVAEAGLDADDARAEVDSGAFKAPVDASTRVAQEHGIAAVPAFVLDGRLLVSGAQPHEVFREALAKVSEMREASEEG
ncbi:MAG TPA: DsbA family oxidoreductase [Miltoncostaeaceae bacterium]|nr:DsbA family oxidoreductase [Miltoncostaeaceae bacterium]